MFICLLFVLLFHVRNACFFECVGDNPGHYPLPHTGEVYPFLSTCCCSPFAAALCLLQILSGPHKFQTGLFCGNAWLKKVISCSYAYCLYCYFMLEMPVSLHVLLIIQVNICYPIRESYLPFSSTAAVLLLLLLSACSTSCLGPIFLRVGCDEALLKILSSIVGFGYSWECIDDGGWSLMFDWNPFTCWLVGSQSVLIETPFSSVGWTSFKLSATSINYLLLLGNPSS